MTLTQKHPEPEQISFNPVIMAGGLWSDITAWDEAGKEIASGVDDGYLSDSIKYAPRDVWLAELTGGPGTECDTCPDYTYDDVVDKHWPALVGGVIKMTNKWPVAYVGHSNGGRVALDALKNLSVNGPIALAGKLANGSSFNLPSNPITTFVWVGVPGAFAAESPFAKTLGSNKDDINSNIQSKSLTHVRMGDITPKYLNNLIPGEMKISFNLWKKYAEFMNSTTDNQPGIGVNLSKTLMIAGTLLGTHDEIVPVNDVDTIYSNIGVNAGAGNKKVLVHIWDGHLGMTETKAIKRLVKQFLNDDPLTHGIENEVNG